MTFKRSTHVSSSLSCDAEGKMLFKVSKLRVIYAQSASKTIWIFDKGEYYPAEFCDTSVQVTQLLTFNF